MNPSKTKTRGLLAAAAITVVGLVPASANAKPEGAPTKADVSFQSHYGLPAAAYSLVCQPGMSGCSTQGRVELATASEVTAEYSKRAGRTKGVGPLDYTQANGTVSMTFGCEGTPEPWLSQVSVDDTETGELAINDIEAGPGNSLSVILNHGGSDGDEFPLETVERSDGGCDAPVQDLTQEMGQWYFHFYFAHKDANQATNGDISLAGLTYDSAKGLYSRGFERFVSRPGTAGYQYFENTRIEVEPEWCAGDQNKIVSAVANGEAIGLGERFFQGQVITAPPGTRIVLGDESVIELEDGGKFSIDECDTSFTGVALTGTVRKFWAHVKKIAAGSDKKFEVQTERAVAGVRGTIFSVGYDKRKQLTTLDTEEGSVWFKSQGGAKKGKVIVDAGESAIQKGKGKPKMTR